MNDNIRYESFDFIKGLKEGITLYAWWKDGTQYVGSCGTTLKKALEDVDKEFKPKCEMPK